MHSGTVSGNPSLFRWRKPAVVVLSLCLFAGGVSAFLNSKGHRDAVNHRASELFGQALQKAGIPTQSGPSK